MKNEFVTYEQALALKELGFDEPCLAFYDGKNTESFYFNNLRDASGDYIPFQKHDRLKWFGAPLYQQAFRWFREKHDIQGYIYSSTVRGNVEKTKQFTGYIWNINGIDMPFLSTDARDELHDTYEEAEQACLDKLIEICKNK